MSVEPYLRTTLLLIGRQAIKRFGEGICASVRYDVLKICNPASLLIALASLAPSRHSSPSVGPVIHIDSHRNSYNSLHSTLFTSLYRSL